MQILDNGVIIHPKQNDIPPKLPAGFRRKSEQGDDQWIFIPLGPHSGNRPGLNLATFQPDSRTEIQPKVEGKVQMGTPRIQKNGEVHYIKKGKTPPAELRGYERKNDNLASPDAWKFTPIFPPCAHRTTQLYRRGCGSTGVHLVCNLTKAICTHENWNPCKDIT